jgi:hypothetical protein
MNDTSAPNGTSSASDLISHLGSPDDAVRGPAWQQEARSAGAAAVGGLVEAMHSGDMETARAAKRALWNLVDYSGRPGAEGERKAVVVAVREMLNAGKANTGTLRELLWMLSTIGEGDVVPSIAAFLEREDLREDARCVLQRFAGPRATEALRLALSKASGEFAHALADALRVRGEVLHEFPSRRLVPVKQTSVGSAL